MCHAFMLLIGGGGEIYCYIGTWAQWLRWTQIFVKAYELYLKYTFANRIYTFVPYKTS